MAQYYECDRCKSKSANSEHTTNVTLPEDADRSKYNTYKRDLCSSCCKQLKIWISDGVPGVGKETTM